MECTLEYNPCNSLTVTGEEGRKGKKKKYSSQRKLLSIFRNPFPFEKHVSFLYQMTCLANTRRQHVLGSNCLNSRWSHLKETTKTLSIWHACLHPGGDKGKEQYFQVAEWTWLLSWQCVGRPVHHLTFFLSLHEDDFLSEDSTVQHYT